jgi:hypothetical protein
MKEGVDQNRCFDGGCKFLEAGFQSKTALNF